MKKQVVIAIYVVIQKNVKIGYASTYNVEILNSFNPKLQLKDAESVIKRKLIELLTQLKGFKFVTTLALLFKKIESKNKTKYHKLYSSSNAEIIINKSGIDDLTSIYTTIITNIQKSLGKGSGWIIDSVIDHTISISKYNSLAGSRSIKLPKELDHPRKVLINIQNADDNPADHNPRRITKADKDFAKGLDFKDINFQSKLETFIKKKEFHRH